MTFRPFPCAVLPGLLLGGTLAVLAGCTPGPAYVRPRTAAPAHYLEGDGATPPAGWQAASPADAQPRGAWWQVFGDRRLDALEARVAVSNQSVAKALAQLDQARAQVRAARAGYAPVVGVEAAARRFRSSANVVGHQLAGKTLDNFDAGLDASWEPDLFDRVGHQVDAATAQAQASAADLASVTLSMQADLAVAYINLRQLDAEDRLLQQTVAGYRQAQTIVQQQFNAGAASASDLAQAQAQLKRTQAQQVDLGVARARYQHAIATLIGEPAASFQLTPEDHALPVPAIPVGVPSALLQRRPDIAAAERRVAAANAQVGEAHAAFFPQLVLSASGGVASTAFSRFAALPSRFWAIGPALLGTLFDGGRRHADLKGAEAAFAGAVADYRQSVLGAFQQVEDNLAALDALADEAGLQGQAVTAAESALRQASDRYQGGAVSYLNVVVVQSQALADRQAALEIDRRRLVASVLLIKALGGAWSGATGTPMGQSRPG